MTATQAHGRLATNVSWLLASQVATKFATLIALFLLARYLGQQLFGRYAVALAIPTALEAFADLGVSWSIVRDGAGRPDVVRRLTYAALPLKLGLGVLLVGLSYGIAAGLSLPAEIVEATLFLAIAKAFDSLTYLCRTVFQASERMEFDAAAQSFDGILRLVLIAYALFSGFGLVGIAKAATVAAAVTFSATAAFAVRRFLSPLTLRVDLVPALVAAGLPLGAIWLLDSLALRVGTIMTGDLLGDAAAGNLAASIRLVEPMLTIPAIMGTALLPLTARHLVEGRDTLPWLVQASFKLVLLLGVAATVGLVGIGPIAVNVVFGEDFTVARDLIRVVALAVPPLFVHALLLAFLVALRSHRGLIASQLAGLLASVTITVVLLPLIGPVGAAVGLVVGEIVLIAVALTVVGQLRELGLARALAAVLVGVPAILVLGVTAGLGEIVATPLALLALVLTVRGLHVIEPRELVYLQAAVPRATWMSRLLLAPLR